MPDPPTSGDPINPVGRLDHLNAETERLLASARQLADLVTALQDGLAGADLTGGAEADD